MKDKEPLELDTRNKIYLHVKSHPGVHLREIQRTFDMPLGTVVYHLRYLEKFELLSCSEEGGYKRYYAKGECPVKDKQLLALLRQPTPRKIVMHLLAEPNQTHKELAEKFDIAPSTLSFHLNKLIKRDVVKKTDNKEQRYFVENEAEVVHLLIKYKSSFVDDVVERFVETWSELHP